MGMIMLYYLRNLKLDDCGPSLKSGFCLVSMRSDFGTTYAPALRNRIVSPKEMHVSIIVHAASERIQRALSNMADMQNWCKVCGCCGSCLSVLLDQDFHKPWALYLVYKWWCFTQQTRWLDEKGYSECHVFIEKASFSSAEIVKEHVKDML